MRTSKPCKCATACFVDDAIADVNSLMLDNGVSIGEKSTDADGEDALFPVTDVGIDDSGGRAEGEFVLVAANRNILSA